MSIFDKQSIEDAREALRLKMKGSYLISELADVAAQAAEASLRERGRLRDGVEHEGLIVSWTAEYKGGNPNVAIIRLGEKP